MHKIVLNIGLLIFFISIIAFAQMGLPPLAVLGRSFVVFIILTIMINLISLLLMRFITQISFDKQYANEKEKLLAENILDSNKVLEMENDSLKSIFDSVNSDTNEEPKQ